jgi:hypothetical protein
MNYEAITALWPIVSAVALVCFLGLVWGLRLEGKQSALGDKHEALQKEHIQLRSEHNNLNNKTLEEISKMREQLARIETALMFKTRRRGATE